MAEALLVLESDDLVVMYGAKNGRSALTIFTQDDKHKLADALQAVNMVAVGVGARARFRPAQGKTAQFIAVSFAGELTLERRTALARAFINVIKELG